MNPMKRVRLAVVVLMLGAIVGASPALAANKGGYTVTLAPPAVDPPEPGASGTLTYETDYSYSPDYTGEATVSCRGLTPGNEYDVQFLVVFQQWSSISGTVWESYSCETHRVAADKKGRLTTRTSYWGQYFLGMASGLSVLDVCVRNDQGNVVLLGRDDPSWWPVSY